ncbi:MAG: glycine cleavage system aminomethyltransferase GcvT [Pseudomonadales bacterium]
MPTETSHETSDQASHEERQTPLFELHQELGAKMVGFAGYQMPVQYLMGVKAEHLHTRSAAGLFDVSHMGQFIVSGKDAGAVLEALLPIDVAALTPGQQQYSQFTNEQGGVLDDLIVCRWLDGQFFLVVNAACKEQDLAWIEKHLTTDSSIEVLADQALIALQGPKAVDVLSEFAPAAAQLTFMHGQQMDVCGVSCFVTRSGYTGEDGFEISAPANHVETISRQLLAHEQVAPIGLGARDSLRLEAGLCLYGHELDTDTTPIEAGLLWSIAKSRRVDGDKAGGFPGAATVLKQISEGAARKRVGLEIIGRAPVRDGAVLMTEDGEPCGTVCSGGFGPSVGGPIAMAYVATEFAKPDTVLHTELRGRSVELRVCKLPFVAHNYKR